MRHFLVRLAIRQSELVVSIRTQGISIGWLSKGYPFDVQHSTRLLMQKVCRASIPRDELHRSFALHFGMLYRSGGKPAGSYSAVPAVEISPYAAWENHGRRLIAQHFFINFIPEVELN